MEHIFSTLFQKPLIAIWILFCLIPLIDEFIVKDIKVPTPKEMKENENKFSFKLPLYTFIALDWLAMFFTLNYLVSSNPGILNTIILLYILGGFGSMNLTVAHELLHKDNKLDKFLGTYSMIKNLYQHYSLEHVFGHHRHVGTPLDAVSASKGMPFDKIFIPAVINQYKQAWTHEQHIPILQQKMYWYTIQQMMMLLIIYFLFGLMGTIYFVVQAFISIRFLEVANYVEHYGLRRKEISPGQFEAIQPKHSWNSNYSIVNYILFKLQRHSDHHIHPFREYQNLVIEPDYPLLPCSYLTAFNLANFSNAWFDVMDNLIDNKDYLPTAIQKVKNFQQKQTIVLTILGLAQLLI
ncbi:hypothetical protein pb186bvf_013879 [Paramecium bursaria]